eukprot:CAMPEP_0198249650 /NCGR_PEP_ID=MMETSP1447-20131203/1106_1 /TAXON_ID=420782 /ORGANISM="Chaetoceros dichaeta, Strain CCMP1751" /LENGTH=305 /DNA_ID=CAMNT_0043934333 /DNA_START=37 /DNA_END=954 /DNA_ORIENTATION=-
MPRIHHLIFLLLLLLTTSTIMSATSNTAKTYYETLEIPKDASSTTIKKAYRRLALKYHPDKNRDDPSGTTTEKFRTVSEAYEVLSDESQKKEYDRALRNGMSGGAGGGNAYGGGSTDDWQNQWQRNRRSNSQYAQRDPFAQFNDLFQNDPFFREASEGLEDLFSKTFQRQDQQQQQTQQGGDRQRTNNNNNNNNNKSKQGWGAWIIDKLGIDVQMSSTTVDRNGHTTSTKTFSQQSNRRSRTSYSSSSSSTYTSKSTRTVMENGKRVTIQSMEKDGNKIEEKYVGTTLVGRSINGVKEQVGTIEF